MKIVELTSSTWPLLDELFTANKTVSWCFCMWFMQTSAEMDANDNRAMLHSKLGKQPIGLLAVDEDRPIGWVAVAPRAVYTRLATSKVTARADEDTSGVWSVTCFFVHRSARRQGVTKALLEAAVEYAGKNGAKSVEGYPVDTAGERGSPGDLYHGTLKLFLDTGFGLVEPRGKRRALVTRTC